MGNISQSEDPKELFKTEDIVIGSGISYCGVYKAFII